MKVRTAHRAARSVPLVVLALVLVAGCAPSRTPVRGVQAVAGLTIDNAAIRQWRFLYTRVAEVEWLTCLYGRVESSGVHVERSELADVTSASYAGVTGTCGERAGTQLIGLAHSHPPLPDGRPSCIPSGVDTQDLGRVWQVIVVVCGTDADAVTVGYRTEGRHPVVRTFTVPQVMPRLVLGEESAPSRR